MFELFKPRKIAVSPEDVYRSYSCAAGDNRKTRRSGALDTVSRLRVGCRVDGRVTTTCFGPCLRAAARRRDRKGKCMSLVWRRTADREENKTCGRAVKNPFGAIIRTGDNPASDRRERPRPRCPLCTAASSHTTTRRQKRAAPLVVHVYTFYVWSLDRHRFGTSRFPRPSWSSCLIDMRVDDTNTLVHAHAHEHTRTHTIETVPKTYKK